jgi:hypothetical protein
MKVLLPVIDCFLFSRNWEFKESHDNQSQRAGHVGTPMFVEGGVVESRREAALTGLWLKMRLVGRAVNSPAPSNRGARHRRPEFGLSM